MNLIKSEEMPQELEQSLERWLSETKQDVELSSSMKETSLKYYRYRWYARHIYKIAEVNVLPDGRQFIVVSSGYSGEKEPEWPTYIGSLTLDGTVLWGCKFESYEDWPAYNPNTGEVIGGGCQAKEAQPKYIPPLFEEREI